MHVTNSKIATLKIATLKIATTESARTESATNADERGSAIIIAVLIMGLLAVFAALALTRVSNEALVMGNDAAEGRAFFAAQASLETMTRNFNKIYEVRNDLRDPTDKTAIQNAQPTGFGNYGFTQTLTRLTPAPSPEVIKGEPYAGLTAIRDKWQLTTVAEETSSGVEVQLTRTFINNRVPIFQFGVFYDDDMEFHPGPRFAFGGRVHSNRNIFFAAGTGLYFNSVITAANHIVTEKSRSGRAYTDWGDNVFIRNASGSAMEKLAFNMGSVRNGPDILGTDSDMPDGTLNPDWSATNAKFGSNLVASAPPLSLPIKLGGINTPGNDYVELIRRGKIAPTATVGGDMLWNPATLTFEAVTTTSADDEVRSRERYANKPGIRISLSDKKHLLPGCATTLGVAVTTACGVRLDGASDGLGGAADTTGAIGSRGYAPVKMTDWDAATGTKHNTTRLNGHRLNGETWIKIELVSKNATTGLPETRDVTQDILSLGVTEPAPVVMSGTNNRFVLRNDVGGNTYEWDTRAIIKLQRWAIRGNEMRKADGTVSDILTPVVGSGAADKWNVTFVADGSNTDSSGSCAVSPTLDGGVAGETAHQRDARANDCNNSARWNRKVVPFPIKMYDTREGLYNEDINEAATYGGAVTRNGVMSMIDIDINNMRRFLNGEFDTKLPTTTPYAVSKSSVSLKAADVPTNDGWLVYVSDRRGDLDFDGEYDMEDVFGNNDGTLQPGENVNRSRNSSNVETLDAKYCTEADTQPCVSGEAARYAQVHEPDLAAVVDTRYFRRAVRLINGSLLPGDFDDGFTVASENGIYVLGDYNATSVDTHDDGADGPTLPTAYNPYADEDAPATGQVPASVVGDSVTILSNEWNGSTGWSDAQSFLKPYTAGDRDARETTVRTAILAGDAITTLAGTPNQGGGDPRMAGGVHNFKRFLQDWGGVYLNYCGSLINLYNARSNNGTFKCCGAVYSPPSRNWVFDASFLDPDRLPPGTPMFQFVQITGFQRINN